jgi:hypothetical protein
MPQPGVTEPALAAAAAPAVAGAALWWHMCLDVVGRQKLGAGNACLLLKVECRLLVAVMARISLSCCAQGAMLCFTAGGVASTSAAAG